MVQRRVGEQQADERVAGRDLRRERRTRRGGATSTIGRSADIEQVALFVPSSTASRSAAARSRDHHRERLLVAPLALRAGAATAPREVASQARWKPPSP